MARKQDVMKVAANAYRLIMENEKVRVMEIKLKPGEKAPMHNHPSPHVIFVISGTKMKLTGPDGKSNVVDLKEGQAVWMEADSHEAENVGSNLGHNVVIEIK